MTPALSTKGNPDITFPPNAGKKAIPFSRPGVGYNGSAKIDSWAEAPNDDKTYVLASVGGNIQWIATTDCDESPTP